MVTQQELSWELTPATWPGLKLLVYARYLFLYGTGIFFLAAGIAFLLETPLTATGYVATVLVVVVLAAAFGDRIVVVRNVTRRAQIGEESSFDQLSRPLLLTTAACGALAVYATTLTEMVPMGAVLVAAFGSKFLETVVRLLLPERGAVSLPDETYRTDGYTVMGTRYESDLDLNRYEYRGSYSFGGLTALWFHRTAAVPKPFFLFLPSGETADRLETYFESDP